MNFKQFIEDDADRGYHPKIVRAIPFNLRNLGSTHFVFLIGLAIDVMLFCGLIGSYFVLRIAPPDLPHLHENLIGIVLASLALAAGFLSYTVYTKNRNELTRMRVSLVLSLIFMTFFLGLNALEWKSLLVDGLGVRAAFGDIYFLLTGVFYIHILGAMCYALLKFRQMLRWKHYTRSGNSIAYLSYFMYALLIVWAGIYGVVYL